LKSNKPAGPSALYGFCGGLREACWLAAVSLVPLLFSPQALHGFSPFRIAGLQILALIMLVTWLVRMAENRADLRALAGLLDSTAGKVAVAIFLGYGLDLLLSTACSVQVPQSLWGNDESPQGAFTQACFLVVLVSIAAGVRCPGQVDRLVTAIILPAIPLALYALVQSARLDPVFVMGPAGARVGSLAGSPLYLAGHLGFTLLFTVWRLHGIVTTRVPGPLPRWAGGWFYAAVGLLQAGAVLISQSRAAMLSFAVALAFFVLILAARSSRGWFRGILAVATAGAAGCVGLVVVARNAPALAAGLPLGRFAAVSSDSSWQTRTDYWRTAAEIAVSDRPFLLPSGKPDPLPGLRPWLGYGPETVALVFPPNWPFAQFTPKAWPNLHSHFWDQWLNVGAVGTLAYLGLVAMAGFAGLKKMEFIRTRAEAVRFWGITLGSSLGLGGLALLSAGLAYVGLGLELGLVGGLIGYVILSGLTSGSGQWPDAGRSAEASILAVAMAALLFHVLETSVLFPVPATALLFWVCLGLVYGGRPAMQENPRPPASSRVSGGPGIRWPDRPDYIGAVLLALLLLALVLAVCRLTPPAQVSGWDVLWETFGRKQGGRMVWLLPLVFGPTLLGGAFAFAWDKSRSDTGDRWPRMLVGGTLLATATGLLFAVAVGTQLARLKRGLAMLQTGGEEFSSGFDYDRITWWFLALAGTLLVGLAWACTAPPTPAGNRAPSVKVGIFAVSCLGGTMFLAQVLCVHPLLAEARAGWAKDLSGYGLNQRAIDAYGQALRLNPRPVDYRTQLATQLLVAGQAAKDPAGMGLNLRMAEAGLVEGRQLSRFDKCTYVLGELYFQWATIEPDPARRLSLAHQASALLGETMAFNPRVEPALVDSALIDQVFLNEPAAAAAKLQQADRLAQALYTQDITQGAKACFQMYVNRSKGSSLAPLKRSYADRALLYYDRAVTDAARYHQPTFELNMAKGGLHLHLGERPLAMAAFQLAAAEGDPENGWMAENMLAQIAAALGQTEQALTHARAALASAPAQAQPRLRQLCEQIAAAP